MIELQLFWYKVRLLFNRRSCETCKNFKTSFMGDGWNEPREVDFVCKKEKFLHPQMTEFEDVFGKIDFDFATVCPLYFFDGFKEDSQQDT